MIDIISEGDVLEYFRILGKFPYGITDQEDEFLDSILRRMDNMKEGESERTEEVSDK